MYPYDILPGIDLYDVMLCAGIAAAMLVFRLFSDKRDISARLNNFVLIDGAFSVILGYGSAVLFQAVYNALESGSFEMTKNTGATFYGGFIGGAAVFFAFYFGVGHFVFRDGEHKREIGTVTSIAATCVAAAHSLGRVGCLFAGCCYGKVTDSALSVYNAYLDARVVPVQLYESIFLALLFAYLCYRLIKRLDGCLALYLSVYGVWRFFAEYMRTDDRGGSPVSFLTPSQFTAVILVLVGLALMVSERVSSSRRGGSEPNEQ